MAFTYITLTAGSGFRTATGANAVLPRIRARPLVDMVNGVEIVNQEVILPINSSGSATKTLAATTDPGTLPVGNVYDFRVEVAGHTVRQFYAAVPHNAGATVAISSLTALEAPPDFSPAGSTITVQDEGSDLTARSKLNFVGAGVTATDDSANARTTITISGSGSGIAASLIDAKGDLIAGTANDTAARLGVGAAGLALVAASGQTTGLQWAAPAPASHNHAASEITSGTVATARLGSGTADSTTFLRGDQTWATPAGSTTVTANTQTGTSYTLVLGDAGKVIERNNASANTTTVPPNSSVAFPTGTVLEVAQIGAGASTIVAGSGVTIRTPSTLILRTQYSTVALRKRATDEWVLSGDIQ